MARILVLDDKPDDRAAIRDFLQHVGHEVALTDSEDSGFQALAQEEFDLVLLDLELPKKGGSRVLVRLVQEYPDLKVLVTARGGETISTRDYLKLADDRGTVRTLAKPFDGARLHRALDVMLTGAEWRRREEAQ